MNLNPAVLGDSINLNFGGFSFSPSTLQAGAAIVLVFLLLLSLAQFRRHMMSFSIKGAIFGIFIGFLLALILEGFLIIGGRTALTELLGWKDAPKPIANALEAGREKLIGVLGIKDEIPSSHASSNPTFDEAIELLQTLDPAQMKKVKTLICAP